MKGSDMQLSFSTSAPKPEVLSAVKLYLKENNYGITQIDEDRPWGAYYYIDEIYKKRFAKQYFPDKDLSVVLDSNLKITPKFLIIAPNEMLSWQYHDRRGELWNLVAGECGYKVATIDQEPEQIHTLEIGKTEIIPQGARHRLIGSTKPDGKWGIVAEIWSHTDLRTPSSEADNHRLKDKYART